MAAAARLQRHGGAQILRPRRIHHPQRSCSLSRTPRTDCCLSHLKRRQPGSRRETARAHAARTRQPLLLFRRRASPLRTVREVPAATGATPVIRNGAETQAQRSRRRSRWQARVSTRCHLGCCRDAS
eukprot:6213990-Pleurochrysis_carterae.AAC.2